MKLADSAIPELKGWVTLSDIATEAQVTRQYVHRLASDGKFKTIHRAGKSKTFLVATSEATKFIQSRIKLDTEQPVPVDSSL